VGSLRLSGAITIGSTEVRGSATRVGTASYLLPTRIMSGSQGPAGSSSKRGVNMGTYRGTAPDVQLYLKY